jgi:hypothetical protein
MRTVTLGCGVGVETAVSSVPIFIWVSLAAGVHTLAELAVLFEGLAAGSVLARPLWEE